MMDIFYTVSLWTSEGSFPPEQNQISELQVDISEELLIATKTLKDKKCVTYNMLC